MYGVLVCLPQPCEPRPLIRELRVPKLEPHRSSLRLVEPILIDRRLHMKTLQHLLNPFADLRLNHEMVVVREERPRLQRALLLLRDDEKCREQRVKRLRGSEEVLFV
jgi:hypothetical protein